MSIKAVKKFSFIQDLKPGDPFFEVSSIQLETSCVINENEVSNFFKVFWIEEGYGEYEIDFNKFTIEETGLFFLSPGQILTVNTEKVKSGYQISFDKDFYCVETHGKEIACNGVLFNNIHRATYIALEPSDRTIFSNIIQNMVQELEQPGPAHREMLETYLRMLLIQSLRKLDLQQADPGSGGEESNRLVSSFITLIEKHFKQTHSVAEYADKLFITPKSLSKRLKTMGYPTPTQMIRDRIMLQAKRSLRYSDESIKEIAYDLGFEDPAYFTRLFKKETGIAPLAYRENG